MITPRWEEDFPADVRAIVEPVLVRWLTLLPTWCQAFTVRWSPANENTLEVEISHRNRWAILRISPHWLSAPPGDREVAILHELIHVALEPLWIAAERVLDGTTEVCTPLHTLAESQIRDGLECSVEDLANSITRLVQNRAPVSARAGT